jgi:hypothetical protein
MSTSSEYEVVRHAYDDAFHRWSCAERDYHDRRDKLTLYLLEHDRMSRDLEAAGQRDNFIRLFEHGASIVNAVPSGS